MISNVFNQILIDIYGADPTACIARLSFSSSFSSYIYHFFIVTIETSFTSNITAQLLLYLKVLTRPRQINCRRQGFASRSALLGIRH